MRERFFNLSFDWSVLISLSHDDEYPPFLGGIKCSTTMGTLLLFCHTTMGSSIMLFCASKGSAGVVVVFACTTAGELARVSITESRI